MSSDRYAVFGNPIKHSKSPWIHAAFAEQTGQNINYRAHKVELDRFADTASSFFANGGAGLNITVPFKLEAYDFADQVSDRARRARAVNTLAVSDQGIYGDNTDGVGLLRDIHDNLAWPIQQQRVLIVGAGGAVRGILEPLLRKRPASLTIANRTVEKARGLATDFSDLGEVQGCSFFDLAGKQYDLIINATSASLSDEMPPLPENLIAEEGCCYDLTYAPEPTVFMRWAAQNMAWAVSDGLGMLVEQAAESFCIWRGVRPSTRDVIDRLRTEISS